MRKQRMNGIQKNYIVAEAAWKAAKEIQSEKYAEFIALNGLHEIDHELVNADGEVIAENDYAEFNTAYELFAKREIENSGLAWNSYKTAEQALVDFGISIAPVKIGDLIIRETLEKAANSYHKCGNSTVRQNIIDLNLKLDVSTLPEALRA